MSASNDGSESVDQFLARIASLSRKNDEEEAERSRRMEEDMMQARKERRARREGMIEISFINTSLSHQLTLYRAGTIDLPRQDWTGRGNVFAASCCFSLRTTSRIRPSIADTDANTARTKSEPSGCCLSEVIAHGSVAAPSTTSVREAFTLPHSANKCYKSVKKWNAIVAAETELKGWNSCS